MSDFEATVRTLARKYALENAIKHGGKANAGGVIGKIMAEAGDLRSRAKDIPPLANEVVAEVNAMTPEDQRADFTRFEGTLVQRAKREQEGPLKPLPNAVRGKVVLRLAPNPSGPPHFGHGRGMVITQEYKRMYEGTFILRFDDTDTTVKPPWPPAYDMFPETVAWLCGAPADRIIFASDHMARYYEVARDGITRGGLYVCECEGDAFRALKEKAEPCPHRERTVDENLASWERMVSGGFRRGAAVVRVKTDIAHKDPALRDWVAFRIAEEPHPRVGDKYHAWPLLDFQSAVDDHDEKVTHIIRGKDLRDSTAKQEFLYAHMGWTYPETMYWGRVSVHEFGKFSKSILNKAIEAGEYSGWDDPRLPTFPALRRRGFTPEGIRNFWLSFGISEKDVAASIVTLEAENRKVVEPISNHHFFIEDPVKLKISRASPSFSLRLTFTIEFTSGDPSSRRKTVELEEGPEGIEVYISRKDLEAAEKAGGDFRLKGWETLSVLGVDADGSVRVAAGASMRGIDALRGKIFQWVKTDAVPARIVMPDASIRTGLVDPELQQEAIAKIVQLERFGFARVDAHKPELTLYYAHE